jgi:hypothetical protein
MQIETGRTIKYDDSKVGKNVGRAYQENMDDSDKRMEDRRDDRVENNN